MARGARLSGSRFAYRFGDVALAELALYRFVLDRLAGLGFLPVLGPVMVGERPMYGTGFLPTEASNLYHLEKDDLYLTGTSEVALAGIHMDERLEEPPRPRAGSWCCRRCTGRARTPGACSASTSSTRWRCTSTACPSSPGRSTTSCWRTRRGSSRPWACPTGCRTSRSATSAARQPRSTTSRRGSRPSSATARSRRARTPPTTRRAG